MNIKNGYVPTPKQLEFHNSTAKFKALITGVGFGKTAAGANELLKTALEYPKSTHLILSPTSKMMNFATLKEFWKWTPREIIASHHKSNNIITLKNGVEILYLTADNERHIDRLRGIEIGSAWADEIRLQPSYIWDVLLTRLRDKHGPLKIFPTTTPFGYNWLYYYFVKKQNPRTKTPLPNPDDYEYVGGSSLDNPYTPESFKQNLLNQLTGKFGRQEVYGEFTAFEGQVYDNFKHDVHIIKDIPNIDDFKEVIVGIDWGFVHPMAAYIIGLDYDKRAYIIEEYYKSRVDIEDLGEWLLSRKELYKGFSGLYGDPSQPMMINKLNIMQLNVQKANNEIMPGINFVYSLFEIQKDGKPRLFISKDCSNLIDEINAYRYAEHKEDKVQKDEPIKIMDDGLDACRYALFTHLHDRGEVKLLNDPWGK